MTDRQRGHFRRVQHNQVTRDIKASGECPACDATRAVVSRLRRTLDGIDEQTRRPGEPPLREAVAAQAKERLAELNDDRREQVR